MESHRALLLASFSPHPDVTLLRVEAPALATRGAPGHFVMARAADSGWDPFLNEPLFLADCSPEEGSVTLWLPTGSANRDRFRALPLNHELTLLGPLGSPLPQRRDWRHLLLVAEGLALGPLLGAMQAALATGREVALLSVTLPDQSPYPADALPLSIEYQRAPRGSASSLAQEMLRWADGVLAAGSQRFYSDLTADLRAARPGQRGGFAYGLMIEPFGWQPERLRWEAPRVACGLDSCRACLIELRREKRLACSSGPAFDLWEL